MTQKNKMIYDITEDEWKLIENKLPGKAGGVGRPAEDNRAFLRAAFWIARTGAPWRALPQHMANGLVYTKDLSGDLKLMYRK
jgi:transposase